MRFLVQRRQQKSCQQTDTQSPHGCIECQSGPPIRGALSRAVSGPQLPGEVAIIRTSGNERRLDLLCLTAQCPIRLQEPVWQKPTELISCFLLLERLTMQIVSLGPWRGGEFCPVMILPGMVSIGKTVRVYTTWLQWAFCTACWLVTCMHIDKCDGVGEPVACPAFFPFGGPSILASYQ